MDIKDPDEVSFIKQLDNDKLKLLIDFIMRSVEQERVTQRTVWSNYIAVSAAIVAAVTAVATAFLKH